ncbi:cap-specific mRNA (nucleoside-2'-O-)-methyltransferase 2 isoform X2 [Corythoichthys intestinalis]|uniref:cap-specific mRNA (nucleoside-2'-O-)-methyltransferase 2 isoform X2 n=1 Tax=Corythoichthys intestinalis TaxID=161448 RepID=UPI0025A5075E|nr:cap-specific mRNA (nucleoside-2'-O-)-methyltransferase 2 isoform X2 [Corythoichthys intestinalis]
MSSGSVLRNEASRMISSNGTRKKVCRRQQQQVAYMAPCDADTLTEIERLFSKFRTYVKPSNEEWCSPNANVALRQHEKVKNVRLQALKVSLNAVKNQLSDKNIEVWHQHTNSTNRAGKVIATVRSAANVEICTQAWCKFYEILGTFSLLPEEALLSGELNTVHLCEAPGAFISALNHYVKTSERTRYCDWSWAANTLNPYNEANAGAIADDRLIANTLPWWFFGSDNTGDIMLQKHLLELQTFVANMRRVDVVTADGSFDCQENPDEQEALVAPLHYCEVTAALLLLSPGGSFVLKMFTLYEHSSVCLLYLLNCCFRSVSVFKPATSKAGNSEVYIVCLDYDRKEAERPLLSKLIRNYGPHLAARETLFPESSIPQSFLTQHEEMCMYFHTLQVETITENLRLFKGMTDEQRERLDYIRDCTAQEYLRRFQVTFLPRSRWISRNAVSPACSRVSAGQPAGPKKQAAGSFNERRELQSLSWKERVERGHYADLIKRHRCETDGTGSVLQGPLSSCHVDSWYVIVGAAIPEVRNSPFCSGILLNYVTETQAALAEKDLSQVLPCDSCHVSSAASILSDVVALCIDHNGTKGKKHCMVLGSRTEWAIPTLQIEELLLTFPSETSYPQGGLSTMYDAAPAYQHRLVSCVASSLRNLISGDALLLPVPAALTRVSAAIVLCLHACFRSMEFRCPPPSGGFGALLVCAGFCPQAAARILPALAEVHNCIGELLKEEDACKFHSVCDRQVLQFVPMEELLNGGLTDFLRTMNSEIMRHTLHVLMQV